MPQYWCVNFDSADCLKYGIKHGFWMMQYQYEDDLVNVFQGGKKLVVVVGTKKALGMAIRQQDTHKRFTALKRRLVEGAGG